MSAHDPAVPITLEQSEYEFSERQNSLIADLAKKMRLVGVFFILAGLLGLSPTLTVTGSHNQPPLLFSLLHIVLGYCTIKASGGFGRMVESQGRDITHLVAALETLRSMFSIIYWILVVIVIGLFAFFVSLATTVGLTNWFAR